MTTDGNISVAEITYSSNTSSNGQLKHHDLVEDYSLVVSVSAHLLVVDGKQFDRGSQSKLAGW